MFESEVFHERVDMSGIVLTHNSSLSPLQHSAQCFDAFCFFMADNICFCDHEVVTVYHS